MQIVNFLVCGLLTLCFALLHAGRFFERAVGLSGDQFC